METESTLNDLYRGLIMEHFRAPHRREKIAGAQITAQGSNPLCGDEVTLEIRLEGDRIKAAGFTGEGCAISLAAASVFSEMMEGGTLEDAARIIEAFSRFLKGEREGLDLESLEDLTAFEGVGRFPARVKCALLPFMAVKEAIGRRSPS